MEMWLKQSTLMLYTVAVAGMVISSPTLVTLDETKREVNVHCGSSLILRCDLITANYTRFRLFWYLNSSGSSVNDSQPFQTKLNPRCEKGTKQERNDTCVLSNVTQEDSGLYFCKVIVEIPLYMSVNSSGTQVTILKNLLENPTYPSLVTSNQVPPSKEPWDIHWWMWILVGVSTTILIVLLVMCILLRRRCHKSRAPDPIYINSRPMVSKQPSPRPPDKLKAAPSSHHLRTPSPGRRYEESKRRQRQ